MPRYFAVIWLICIIAGILLALDKFGIGAVIFLFPIVVAGFLLSLLVAVIIDAAARIIGSKYSPFASRFDWKDE